MYYLKAKKNAKKTFLLDSSIILRYSARVREKNETMQKTIVFWEQKTIYQQKEVEKGILKVYSKCTLSAGLMSFCACFK